MGTQEQQGLLNVTYDANRSVALERMQRYTPVHPAGVEKNVSKLLSGCRLVGRGPLGSSSFIIVPVTQIYLSFVAPFKFAKVAFPALIL